MGSLVASAHAERLFTDTFSGADGMRPKGWTFPNDPGSGSWVVQKNELVPGELTAKAASNDLACAIVASPAAAQWDTYFIQADFWNPGPSGCAALVGRWQDEKNHYEGGVFSEAGKVYLKIDKIVGGQRQTLARQDAGPSFAIPQVTGMPNYDSRLVLRMVFAGNEVGLFVKGAEPIRCTDSTFGRGRAGLACNGGTVRFDNVIADNDIQSVWVPASPDALAQRPSAPPPLASPGAGAVTAGTGSFQVCVASKQNRDVAEKMRDALKSDGYSPVSAIEKPGGWTVYVGGFSDRTQADSAITEMKSQGYRPESVEDVGAGQIPIPPAMAQQPPTGAPVTDGSAEERATKLSLIFNDYAKAIRANDLDGAERKLKEAQAIDANDPQVVSRVQKLAQLRSPGAASVTPAPTAAPAPPAPAPKASAQAPSRTEPASDEAGAANRQLLIYGGLALVGLVVLVLAIQVFLNARRSRAILAKVNALATPSPSVAAAPTVSASTTSLRPTPPPGPPAPEPPIAPTAPVGGSFLSGSLSDLKPTAQPPSPTPVVEPPPPVAETKAPEPPPPPAPKTSPFDSSGALQLEGLELSSDTPKPISEQPTVQLDGFTLEDIALPPVAEEAPPVPPAAEAPTTKLETVEAVDTFVLGDIELPPGLFDGPMMGAPPAAPTEPPPPTDDIHDMPTVMSMPGFQMPPAAAEPPPEPPQPRIEMDLPPVAVSAAAEPTFNIGDLALSGLGGADAGRSEMDELEMPAFVQPAGVDTATVFAQGFDDEPTGVQPANWDGQYDYASLTVDESDPAPGSSKALKFEKRTGAGGASYSCTFPKASGRVIVEFDIRCDDKNKYLLGFYLEKDGDFKQSIHTVVHRLDSRSQPSLRIHGEPVPYELGTWRRVKYDINLVAGTVAADIDGQRLVDDNKLVSPPPYLNTLSIRDNLATTGVLMLDNIRVTRG